MRDNAPAAVAGAVVSHATGKISGPVSRAVKEAAERLGIDLDEVSVIGGRVVGRIGRMENVTQEDLDTMRDFFSGLGATGATFGSGMIANEKLDDHLGKLAERGRGFKGGRVSRSQNERDDFDIDFDF